MSDHSFITWLRKEAAAARCALLIAYEQRDKLKFVEKTRLEREYMEQVGEYENTVIKEEIECELIRKKQQMIQAAINRRESIDEAAIDAALDEERQKLIAEAVGTTDDAEYNYIANDSNKYNELQELYREIVKNFHPQMHPELTEAHKELFQKAQEAYRLRDYDAMKLIHEMLNSIEENDDMGLFTLELMLSLEVVEDPEIAAIDAEAYITDYALVAQIYSAFKPTAIEASIQEEWVRYRQMNNQVMQEIETMRTQFPFTAEAMLSDPVQLQAYKDDLAVRLRAATTERERRIQEINAMKGSVIARE